MRQMKELANDACATPWLVVIPTQHNLVRKVVYGLIITRRTGLKNPSPLYSYHAVTHSVHGIETFASGRQFLACVVEFTSMLLSHPWAVNGIALW